MSDIDFSFLDAFDEPDKRPKPQPEEAEVVIVPTEVMPHQITQLEAAQNTLAELKKLQDEFLQQNKQAKDAFDEARRQMQTAADKQRQIEEQYRDTHWQVKEAERRVLEEAQLEAERIREAELMARRVEIVADFHKYINELQPAWKDDAFDHQWEGAAKLAMHQGGLLGDEMGLGKTLTSIMFLDLVKAKRILVITPSDTCSNFTIEMAMWATHRYVLTLGNASPQARDNFLNIMLKPRVHEDKDFVVTINREQLYEDIKFFGELIQLNFDTIIIDEAHTFKNTNSLLFQRLLQLKLSPSVERFLPMTGTFILNKPQDIWPALHLLDSDAFPSLNKFLNVYCVNYGDGYRPDWRFREGGLKELINKLGGRIVQRTLDELAAKDEKMRLPQQTIHDIDIEFNPETYLDQQKVIRQLAQHAQLVLDADHKTSTMTKIALITRQRQANVWPGGMKFKNEVPDGNGGYKVLEFSVSDLINESIKVDWVELKVRDLVKQGKRVVVFSQFATGLEELEKRFDDLKAVRYDGSTKRDVKMEVKRDFDRRHRAKDGGAYHWDICLANYKTGGVGLNFTDVTETIILDEEWNPGMNMQAYKRTRRMGQTEETNVWIPRLKKSIDAWMRRLNERKLELVSGFNEEVDLQKEYQLFLDIIKNGYGEDAVS